MLHPWKLITREEPLAFLFYFFLFSTVLQTNFAYRMHKKILSGLYSVG